MDTKSVIFVLISTFLLAAIYSSSFTVPAAARIACARLPNDPNSYTCANDKIKEITLCTKNSEGKWDCTILTDRMVTSIPADLSNAMDAATKGTQNITKVPNDLGGINNLPEISPNK